MEEILSKRDWTLYNTKKYDNFICPICKSKLSNNNYSLICENSHNFDISKKGSIKLLKSSDIKEDKLYNDELFNARRNFILSGFYKKAYKVIIDILKKHSVNTILDLGSGEGSHDYMILNSYKNSTIYALDISKAGINMSESYTSKQFIPILGDIHKLPFSDNSFDCVLNFLSPSNEAEISRVLKNDGILIKLAPKKEYLNELRKIMEIDDYSNEETIKDNLNSKYEVLDTYEVNDVYSLSDKEYYNLIKMTPLTKYKNIESKIDKITITLNIYVCKVR